MIFNLHITIVGCFSSIDFGINTLRLNEWNLLGLIEGPCRNVIVKYQLVLCLKGILKTYQ